MDNFDAALRMFKVGAAATRASWPESIWIRRVDNDIQIIHTDGSIKRWQATNEDLLAEDWTGSSGVIGWTGLNLDINMQPWKPT